MAKSAGSTPLFQFKIATSQFSLKHRLRMGKGGNRQGMRALSSHANFGKAVSDLFSDIEDDLKDASVRLATSKSSGAEMFDSLWQKSFHEFITASDQRLPERTSPRHNSGGGLHLHFGAGKLGMGLIYKSIEGSGCSNFAIVQRPSRAWDAMSSPEIEKLSVNINGERVGERLKIVRSDELKTDFQKNHNGPYFILADPCDIESLLGLTMKARSFSCSLKDLSGLRHLLLNLPLTTNPPKLYACENDHEAVKHLAEQLSGRVKIVPCMVDRICSGRSISATSHVGEGRLDIEAEPWEGQVVVMPEIRTRTSQETIIEEEPKIYVPLSGPQVLNPKTSEEASYFHHRKILMVNGMHTTLAFLSILEEQQRSSLSLDEMKIPGDYPLLNYDIASAATKRILCSWLVARVFMIANEFPLEVLMGAHDKVTPSEALQELVEYAWSSLDRFSHIPDTTGRVLSGGVVTRFNGRLSNVKESLHDLNKQDNAVINFSLNEVLAAAKTMRGFPRDLELTEVESHVENLVEESRPIAAEKKKREDAERKIQENLRDEANEEISSASKRLINQYRDILMISGREGNWMRFCG